MCFVSFDTIRLRAENIDIVLQPGMAFSINSPFELTGEGLVTGFSCPLYQSFFQLVGPVLSRGLLSYIDGCSDTLMIPPVKLGFPCLNHLHFPPHTVQTFHTHPSFRAGVVYKGSGVARFVESEYPLKEGDIFFLPANLIHAFRSDDDSLDVVAFHPDSDFGPTDTDHPMINRTIVNGFSAKFLSSVPK